MERRRKNRSAPELMLQRLLGFQAKLRQYELGKSFCDAVVAREGLSALNGVWASPQALPTRAELDRPATWLERLRDDGVAPQRSLAPGAPGS
jgi:uncharacterized protein (DUF2342 family)